MVTPCTFFPPVDAHLFDENADRAADLISGKLGHVIPAEFAVNPAEV
jgi:hypothetical protein